MIRDLKKPKTFKTIGERNKFIIYELNYKVVFQSPYKGCSISKAEFRKVFERFAKKTSWKTSDYSDITVHASYFLRLLKEYFVK